MPALGRDRSMVRCGRFLSGGTPLWPATTLTSQKAQRLESPQMLSNLRCKNLSPTHSQTSSQKTFLNGALVNINKAASWPIIRSY